MDRRSIAGRFGKTEHWVGRILGISLIFQWVLHSRITLEEHWLWTGINVILWFVYWISHIMEKAFYGRTGSRG